LGASGAGLINALRSPETAKAPDYMALAQEQARLNAEAADKATAAQRVNQTNAMGDTSTWQQDPVTGQWSQKQQFGGANQALYDAGVKAKTGLFGQINEQDPLSMEGLPEIGGELMDARGNSTEIQNAWMNLLKPEREMARAGEIQRLKNQGLTEDSPAFQRAMLRLDQADTDAQNKALIAGTTEYGNIYNRDITGRTSQRADRQSMFDQRKQVHDQPLLDLQNLSGTTPGNPIFGNVPGATNAGAADIYGAGSDAYTAALNQANAKNAASNNLTQGLMGLGASFGKKP
jgi:hypothetical protein